MCGGFTASPPAGAASLYPSRNPPVLSHPVPSTQRRGRGRTGQAQPRRQRAGSQELPGTGEPGLDCISAGAVTSPNLLHLSPFASSPRRAGSYRFSELASVRSQMSCTTSRCLTLRKRGGCCELRAVSPAARARPFCSQPRCQPSWLPQMLPQPPRDTPLQLQALAQRPRGTDLG